MPMLQIGMYCCRIWIFCMQCRCLVSTSPHSQCLVMAFSNETLTDEAGRVQPLNHLTLGPTTPKYSCPSSVPT